MTSGSLNERATRRVPVEHEAHGDRVPELPAAASVVTPLQAFLLEPKFRVQLDGGGVVRPDLQRDLVGAVILRPVDAALHERRSDATAAPALIDQHPEVPDTPTNFNAQIAPATAGRNAGRSTDRSTSQPLPPTLVR
jgi:hypothetical protein